MTPKLTHKERAEKICNQMAMDGFLRQGSALTTIEQAFTQVANEALEEAEKCTYKIRDEWLEEYKSIRADIILGKCFGAGEIAIKIRELKKEQVKS